MDGEGFFELNNPPLPERVSTGLAKVGLALRHQAWQDAGERGLTPTQGQVLVLLLERGERRLSEVADAMAIRAPTASEAVRALVDKGLVTKTPAPGDARALRLTLTAAGKREARRARDWPEFLAEAADALSPDEQAAFYSGLLKMIRVLQERGQIPISRMCTTCRFFRPEAHPEDRARPHHCALVDSPFGTRDLRIDCPEHQPAERTP